MQKRVYLDNNATTELDHEVMQAFVQNLMLYGNPSSAHYHGQQAKNVLVKARSQVASFFKVKPKEVIFTSSGTEANNLIIRGFFGSQPSGHIITSDVEHSSVYNTLQAMEAMGCAVSYLPAGRHGAVSVDQVQAAVRPDTRLICLLGANNETGVKSDIDAIAAFALDHQIPYMVDGVCMVGKSAFSLPRGMSFFSVSGHKFHAPKGIGCAIVREKYKLQPYMTGGPQEWGIRAGTENVAAIVGFATSLQILERDMTSMLSEVKRLRDHFESELFRYLPDIQINGSGDRIVNTSNILFRGIDGESLLIRLDLQGLSVSHGSACASGALEPSRVLRNMGLSYEEAAASIRFSLSRMNTQAEIDQAVAIIVKSVEEQRRMSGKSL